MTPPTFRCPSAVRRTRLHPEQKAFVMEAMKPTVPWNPSTWYVLAVSFGDAGGSWCSPGKRLLIRLKSSRKLTIFSADQRFPSKGMYSMKRTSRLTFFVSCTKSSASSSLTPFIGTMFNLTESKVSLTAASIDLSTAFRPFRRVMASNRSARNVSKLMLTESRPAARRAEHFRAKTIPFVVRPIFCRPSFLSSFN